MTEHVHSSTIDISAPADRVFAIIANPHRHHEFDGSEAIDAIVEGPDRLTPGSSFKVKMQPWRFGSYQTNNKVIEFEQDKLIAWKNIGPQIWRYRLEALPGGLTRVTEYCDYAPWGPLAPIARMLGRTDQKSIAASLPRLKALAESGTA